MGLCTSCGRVAQGQGMEDEGRRIFSMHNKSFGMRKLLIPGFLSETMHAVMTRHKDLPGRSIPELRLKILEVVKAKSGEFYAKTLAGMNHLYYTYSTQFLRVTEDQRNEINLPLPRFYKSASCLKSFVQLLIEDRMFAVVIEEATKILIRGWKGKVDTPEGRQLLPVSPSAWQEMLKSLRFLQRVVRDIILIPGQYVLGDCVLDFPTEGKVIAMGQCIADILIFDCNPKLTEALSQQRELRFANEKEFLDRNFETNRSLLSSSVQNSPSVLVDRTANLFLEQNSDLIQQIKETWNPFTKGKRLQNMYHDIEEIFIRNNDEASADNITEAVIEYFSRQRSSAELGFDFEWIGSLLSSEIFDSPEFRPCEKIRLIYEYLYKPRSLTES
eukprot:TRINITY_DN87_c1_g1_i1.p1 TRINITY_DN87_c1_g1~~TRINITY_DN87_c1_g1_i1.p1  ORF type:complete len:386 (-),score=56.46 TRINITY_DN87_c1_g1_i1:34-1191(-)